MFCSRYTTLFFLFLTDTTTKNELEIIKGFMIDKAVECAPKQASGGFVGVYL